MTTERIHPALPIFRLDAAEQAILYTPGHVAVTAPSEAAALRGLYAGDGNGAAPRLVRLASRLEELATRASEAWGELSASPFEPQCLTVYLSNQCNLGCLYCYAANADRHRAAPVIEERVVERAAAIVARSCARKGRRLTLVLHGGGEPTLHWELLQRVVEQTRRVAERHGVEWWGYVATHGILSRDKAQWLAKTFQRIGLSCDGPPDLQDRQRPGRQGRGLSARLVETARILDEAHADYTVRVTVTPESIQRQAEIVAYVRRELGAGKVKLEPVYMARAGQQGFAPADAERFASHFLAAQAVARELGCELTISGVRLDEIHGPYCNVLRDVLHLTPDGVATACFLSTSGKTPSEELALGRVDPATGELRLDASRLATLRRRATRIPARCEICVNVYHCARECPEVCPALGQEDDPRRAGGFRCRVQKILGESWIRQAAASLTAAAAAARPAQVSAIASILAELPPDCDAHGIVECWRRIKDRFPIDARSLPQPVWARGFHDDGAAAWRQLTAGQPGQPNEAPLSVYVHLPFCDRRCGFCDCHMLKLRPQSRFLEELYVRALTAEIDAWSRIEGLRQRPWTTVHFGGGTPSYLSDASFEKILTSLARFNVTPAAEWALESTSAQLAPARLDRLRSWGFERLHVGVQTLEDPVRQSLGRKEPAAAVLAKIDDALARGFVVSVDLVVGLPGQTVGGFAADLEDLCNLGTHGFSIYSLNASVRNRRFFRRYGRHEPLRSYLLFQFAEEKLTRRGYGKNHFAHFALPPDRNLYYRHALRGEDLLALGMSADGVFGTYHYRHPEFRTYLAGTGNGAPALEGGIREPAAERRIRRAAAALTSATIDETPFAELGVEGLLERWRQEGLLAPGAAGRDFVLTGNGSWCITEMLAELGRAAASSQPGAGVEAEA